jgi:hypothetical protein
MGNLDRRFHRRIPPVELKPLPGQAPDFGYTAARVWLTPA